MLNCPEPSPLLPQAVRGVRWCRGWLHWHLRARWAMERDGWRLPDA